MILAFEFEYAARNAVLENFLRAIASEAKREFYIKKQNETITLFARGDADELKAFSDLLAAELPLSIFLRAASAKAVLEWKPDEASEIEPCEAVIGFTPKSLALAAQSGDFTIAPEIGRGANLAGMPPIDDLIAALREQGRVEIAGKYALSLPDERFCDQNAVIMPTDIGFVANIAIAKEEDIAALGALERPIVRLPINMIFAAAYPDAPRITSVALAGDLYLCLLSRKLAESGVKAIALENYDRLVVTALKDQNIIVSGLTPSAAEKFAAIKEPHYRVFAAAIDERGLRNDANLGFFFSLDSDDRVVFNSPETGAIELLRVAIPSSIADIFASIAKRSQNGAKLVSNYRDSFSETARAIEAISFENAPQNIASLWGAAGALLGLGGDLKQARQKLIEHIAFFGGLRAPSVDYKLSGGVIDWAATLSSVISLKLAGASDDMIAYALCESLARFLSDLGDLIASGANAEAGLREARNADSFLSSLSVTPPQNIFLLGSLFSLKPFSQLTIAYMSPAKKPFFPNELPLELNQDVFTIRSLQ